MSSPDNHLYEFGQFVLDARSRILLKDGVTVRLTPKAFDTLLVLIQHGVQLVEKEQLLKEVWPDTFVEQGSLSRNIHELRKALGDDSGEPRYIETIPKRGYRLLTPVKVTDAAGDAQPARAAPRPAAIGNTAQRKKHFVVIAAVVALLLVASIATFVYLQGRGVQTAPAARAKSTLIRLTNNNAQDAGPAWSPDGKQIAFRSNRDGKTRSMLWTVTAQT